MAYIRQNDNVVKGDQLWLFISKTVTAGAQGAYEAGNALPICFATSCSLNRSLATNSISSKDHGTTSFVSPGEGSWTASTEALYSMNPDTGATGFEDLMEIFDLGQKVKVSFGYVTNGGENIVDVEGTAQDPVNNWSIADGDGWYGEGYLTSLQASGSHGDAATFSCEITGIGPLKVLGTE